MSQVLALKAGMKRPFDDMSTDLPHPTQPPVSCSPHRISFLESPATKRLRTIQTHASTPPPLPPPVKPRRDEELVKYVPKRLRKVVLHVVGRGGCATERLFTIEDVKEIVEKVCEDRVKGVKEECEKVIQERLTDQWKVFTRYHEDFVARSYRGRDISYLS